MLSMVMAAAEVVAVILVAAAAVVTLAVAVAPTSVVVAAEQPIQAATELLTPVVIERHIQAVIALMLAGVIMQAVTVPMQAELAMLEEAV